MKQKTRILNDAELEKLCGGNDEFTKGTSGSDDTVDATGGLAGISVEIL